jgi:uncharacterized phage protein (TIGR01671 family)
MRTIKFRGKTPEGKWVYGDLIKDVKLHGGDTAILPTNDFLDYEIVIPETVGQFTGLPDKNGKEYYEGDIAEMEASVEYDEGSFIITYIGEVTIIPSMGVCLKNVKQYSNRRIAEKYVGYKKLVSYRSEKIGNIYDNPELLNETK